MTDSKLPESQGRTMTRKLLMGTGAIMLASAAVLYGIMGGGGKEASTACASSARTVERFAPLATGGLAAMTIPKSPRPAIDVTFDGPNGEKKSLADFRGKAILLNLWATWCIPCRTEMPSIEAVHQALAPQGLKVVAVSIDDEGAEQKILDFAKEFKLTFEMLHDPSGSIQGIYRTTGVPETFVIGRDGVIRKKWIGAEDWNSDGNQRLLSSLLAEPKP